MATYPYPNPPPPAAERVGSRHRNMKKQYLICYDYGMGGIWRLMTATTQNEITEKYPCIQIVQDRPEWMTDAVARELNSFDIDDEPRGWLAKMKS